MPELSAKQAALVHQQLTKQTLNLVTKSNLCQVQLWCSPNCSDPFFKQMKDDFPVTLLPQSEGDLGQRMLKALTTGNRTFEHVILLGCDCPSLRQDDIVYAINALETNYDTVLAPAEDGGYCLIGMKKPHAELFDNIAWGSNTVLDKTREKILEVKSNCLELQTQWDVDNYSDYLRFMNLLS